MRRRGIILTILGLLLLVGNAQWAPAQETGRDAGADQPDSGEAELEAEAEQDLFADTIARDIASAGFYELVAWLQSLDLPIDGERATLQRRLAVFYDVSPEQLQVARSEIAPAPSQGDSGRSIVIDSASRTRYFTIDEIDERYIRLSGDVVVTLTDENDGTHRIRADEITLNQEQNTLSASGSVVYTLERGATTERFVGEALTVQLDSFEGAFIRGQTEREREIEGEEVDFEFAGEYITRSEDDVIVLDNGRITSSQADPPNYHIRARKIWVLAPGEWGLSNATLYVGRVPLFYLPFFFRPGDRLFFNPAVGTNDRKGLYIQTTTYLLGRAEERASTFSFLQLTETADERAQLERDGLFLVSTEEPGEAPPEGTIRLIIDFYSRLGAFVGVEGEVPTASVLRDVDFYAGLAASRNLYLTSAGYTPYLVADGDARVDWNETTLGSLSLPFRFGLSFSGSLADRGWNANAEYAWFSDQRFLTDFGNRAEQIDWAALLGQGDVALAPGPINELVWLVSTSYRPVGVDMPPALSTVRLDRARLSLRFAAKEVNPTLLAPEVLLADQSPELSFFYPTVMRLPDISGQIGGTLFTYPAPNNQADEPSDELPEIVSPWQEEEPDDEEPPEESEPIVAPPLQASLPPGALLPSAVTANLAYTLTPSLLIDHQFDSSEWQEPRDVDFQVEYRGASSRVSARNTLDVGILDGLFSVDSSLSLSGQHRTVFDRSESVDDAVWSNLEEQAWNFTTLSLSNANRVAFSPLLYVPRLSKSVLSYTTELLLYRYTFDEVVAGEPTYTGETIVWDDTDFVRRHELSSTLAVDVGELQTLTLTAILPPLDERYAASITLRRRPFTLTASSARAYVDERWRFDPLRLSLVVSFPTVLRFENELTYDLNDNEPSVFTSGLTWRVLGVRFEARNTEGYRFDGLGAGWELNGDETFRPVSLDLSFNPRLIAEPFWRGRIGGTLNADVGLDMDFLRFTQSSLNLGMNGTFAIHEFMAIGFSFASSNSQVYAYVPTLAERVGRAPKPLLPDLIRSLNIFSVDARRQSAFKLERIQFGLLHDLGDWDLTVLYRASPELQTTGPEAGLYEIDRFVELVLQWRPIEELSASARIEEGELSIGDDS